ncbi:IS21 family transposase [Yoonia sp.]|uniref:IS21 family transposase n=2 Tax=Yoonia sp. TaxID=2212373 RepID=UPI002DFBC0F9|nr:IS21 family transposase [Yoonia sp.]
METAMKIRGWILGDGRSIHSVARETGISRTTIKKYLKNPEQPRYRRQQPRVGSKLNAQFEVRLRELFEHDLSLRRRDRRTAKKLYEELVAEGYTGSYSPVQRFVSELKKSSGTDGTDAFIPLYFVPGDALQFDWSEEYVLLGGVQHKVHVAHFRLCHSRKPFVVAYMNEKQEMVLDAFVRALSFFGGVPRRVIIDNPKTMVTYVSRSKDRIFHPRFLALMNHYVIDPVACTPASGWEKGQVENQVQFLRGELFTPRLVFDDLAALNAWLLLRCEELAERRHTDQQHRTIADVFEDEKIELRPLGRPFDGYVEKTVRVRSTCLVQYDSNRYSVPCEHAGHHVSLRAYADRLVMIANDEIIAEHKRRFTRNISYFEPWHYVPLLDRKPGALRDGAPFVGWELPKSMEQIKDHYMREKGGDREFVDLLLLALEHGIDVVEMACDLAIEQRTLRLPAIINLVNQLLEPTIAPLAETHAYPQLSVRPQADCKRYEALCATGRAAV